MLNSEKAQKIRRLHRQGETIRAISNQLDISRNTVRNYLRDINHGIKTQAKTRAFKLDSAEQEKIKNLFTKTRGNSRVICRRLQNKPTEYGLPEGFTVSDRSVRRFFSARYPQLVNGPHNPTFEFTTEPGAQLQIDFVKASFQFAGKPRKETVYIFGAVYSWSRKSYIRVCSDMTQTSWLMSIADCMSRYGVPREILCDNDRCLVTEHARKKDGTSTVRFHKAFIWLCEPLRVRPRACIPRRAATKGRVERFGRFLQENGLADCAVDEDRIKDRHDLQLALDKWIKEVADKRLIPVSDNEKRTVEDLYEEEKSFLHFPTGLRSTFDITTWTAVANKQGTINVYGTAIELGIGHADQLHYVSLRANGEVLVMSKTGDAVQAQISPANMSEYQRDQAAVKAIGKTVYTHEHSLNEYDEIIG